MALVGAYRTTAPDNGEPLDILFRIIARARATGPFYFAGPTVHLLYTALSDNALFYSALFLFCFAPFFPLFWSRYFSAAARSLLRRRTTSTRIRPNFAAPVAQIYNRDYAASAP